MQCPGVRGWLAKALPELKTWNQDPNPTRLVGVCYLEGTEPKVPATVYDVRNDSESVISKDRKGKKRKVDEAWHEEEVERRVTRVPGSMCFDAPAPQLDTIAGFLLSDDPTDENGDDPGLSATYAGFADLMPAASNRDQDLAGFNFEFLFTIHDAFTLDFASGSDGASSSGSKP